MIKFINKIKEKYGEDKLTHLFGGAWLVSLLSPFKWLGILIGFLIMLVFSFVKEKFLDDHFDKLDILFACIGSIISALCYLLISIFL